MHTYNSFITLTYSEEKLKKKSLDHRDWQLFMKRLRKKLSQSSNQLQSDCDLDTGKPKPISYYMAGEYGTIHRRPHFHACLFGIAFKDQKYWKRTASGSPLYISAELDQLWGQGFTSIGEVTFQSAAYIARYILAKQTGKNASHYYENLDPITGEIEDLKPEYNRMSLKNPIGKTWLQKYKNDVFPEGEVLLNKTKTKTPKYYDKEFKKQDIEMYEEMKMKRELQALEYRNDNTPQRLQAKERVKLAQINRLSRNLQEQQ